MNSAVKERTNSKPTDANSAAASVTRAGMSADLIRLLERTADPYAAENLIRLLGETGLPEVLPAVRTRIAELPRDFSETNRLMNAFVEALGRLGTCRDLQRILRVYAREYVPDGAAWMRGLCRLVPRVGISGLTESDKAELCRLLRVFWNPRDREVLFDALDTFEMLGCDFFLKDRDLLMRLYGHEPAFAERAARFSQAETFPSPPCAAALRCRAPAATT